MRIYVGGGKGRILLIEYLRGLAALSVVWFHLTTTYPDNWVRASGSLGWLGVEVFFVISGFVIPLSIASAYAHYSVQEFPRFLTRRLLRLEPPYLLSVFLALLLWQLSAITPGFQGADAEWNSGQILAHLLYLIPLTDYAWLQPVYWSLAWEFAFYILMGLLFPLVGTLERRVYWYLVAGVLSALVLFDVLNERVLLFVIGIAIYRIHAKFARAHSRSPEPGTQVERFANLTIVAVAGGVIATTEVGIAVTGVMIGLLILFFSNAVAPSWLNRPLLFLGACSYSLYLTHVLIGGRVINLGRRFVEGPYAEFLLSLFALLFCLLFAWLFMLLIERPSVALAKQWTSASSR